MVSTRSSPAREERRISILFLIAGVWMDSAECSHQRIRPEIAACQAYQTGNTSAEIGKYRKSNSANQQINYCGKAAKSPA